jgi:hypothetical protein
VFNRTIAYRDKKVVGVFVRFSCAAEALIHLAPSGERSACRGLLKFFLRETFRQLEHERERTPEI